MVDKRVLDATSVPGRDPGGEFGGQGRSWGQFFQRCKVGWGRAGGVSWGISEVWLWRKSEGEAAALIARLAASSMPVMLW